MTDEEYEKFTERMSKSNLRGLAPYSFPRDWAADVFSVATALSRETQELKFQLQDEVGQAKPYNREEMLYALGNVEYYMARLRRLYGISREEILNENVGYLTCLFPERAQAQ